jgi:hypothetical protein
MSRWEVERERRGGGEKGSRFGGGPSSEEIRGVEQEETCLKLTGDTAAEILGLVDAVDSCQLIVQIQWPRRYEL